MEFRLRPLGFMGYFFFYKTTIIRQLTKWNESKIEKILSKTVGILLESSRVIASVYVCVCVFVCVCVNVCGCIHEFEWVKSEHYCVCMCRWLIVYVYMKVHAQCVVFTRYKVVLVPYFCFIILFLYVWVNITKEQNIIIACLEKKKIKIWFKRL